MHTADICLEILLWFVIFHISLNSYYDGKPVGVTFASSKNEWVHCAKMLPIINSQPFVSVLCQQLLVGAGNVSLYLIICYIVVHF